MVVKPFPLKNNVTVNLRDHSNQCGANNFYYGNGTIEFVVNGIANCQVRVRLTNFIQLTTRLDIPFDDFYLNNGVTTFLTNICAFLGIDTSRLKIVGFRSGSVIIDAIINANGSNL